MLPVMSIINLPYEKDIIDLSYSAPMREDFVYQQHINILRKKFIVNNSVDYSDDHHLVHANLAFYDSGFEEALVFVVDRNGSNFNNSARESESVYIASYPNNFTPIYKSFWLYSNSGHELVSQIKQQLPDCDIDGRSMFGIVKVYETATSLIRQHALENGKTMGLSAYGNKQSKYDKLFSYGNIPNDSIFGHLDIAEIRQAINIELDPMSTSNVSKDDFEIYANYAWQVQQQTQEALAYLVEKYVSKTGIKKVCLTGGYALNVVANHYLISKFPDVDFFFEPIADDSGNSIGSAMKMYRDITLDKTINKLEHTFFNGVLHNLDNILGRTVSIQDVADLISKGKSVGVYQGLAEAGPRALGNRSILFDARDPNAKDKVNLIKNREWYRPFAGMVLKDDAPKYFDMGRIKESKFMTISFPVKESMISKIPGVVHIDNTCRIQTIDDSNYYMNELLKEFKKITKIPIILNTSLNRSGEPLVETPQEAIDILDNTVLDYMWFPEKGIIVGQG